MSLRCTHVEILLRNYLDRKFQIMLAPLNFMQHICFNSKCHICDNFITPKTLTSNIVSFIGSAFFVVLLLLKMFTMYRSGDMQLNSFLTFLTYFDVHFYAFGVFLNLFITVTQSDNFVAMILKMKDVHEVLNDEKQFRIIIIRNWLLLFILTIFYAIINIILYNNFHLSDFYEGYYVNIIGVNILWSFDANILYAKGIILFIRYELELWIKEVQKYANDVNFDRDENIRLNVLQSYFDLLQAYELFKKVFQLMVSILK